MSVPVDTFVQRHLPPGLRQRLNARRTNRRRSPVLFRIVIGFLALVLVIAIIGPWIAPASVNTSNILNAFAAPSAHHWLGTDAQGRDVLWRVIVGARYSVLSAIVVVAGYSIIGVVVASLAATGGRIVDLVLMRISDAGLALPPLVFALGIAAVLGGGLGPAIIALIATGWPFTARQLRETIRTTSQSPFVEGARVLGLSRGRCECGTKTLSLRARNE